MALCCVLCVVCVVCGVWSVGMGVVRRRGGEARLHKDQPGQQWSPLTISTVARLDKHYWSQLRSCVLPFLRRRAGGCVLAVGFRVGTDEESARGGITERIQ